MARWQGVEELGSGLFDGEREEEREGWFKLLGNGGERERRT